MVVNFTASTSFVGNGKRIGSLILSQGTGTQTVRIRRGAIGGSVVFEVQLVATSSKEITFSALPYVQEGVYVEVVGTGLNNGAIDLV